MPSKQMNRQKLSIVEMRDLASKRGGECLSTTYINSKTPLIWKCNLGHIFEATPEKIKQGHWCWDCGREKQALERRTTIQEIQSTIQSCILKEKNFIHSVTIF